MECGNPREHKPLTRLQRLTSATNAVGMQRRNPANQQRAQAGRCTARSPMWRSMKRQANQHRQDTQPYDSAREHGQLSGDHPLVQSLVDQREIRKCTLHRSKYGCPPCRLHIYAVARSKRGRSSGRTGAGDKSTNYAYQ